MRTKSVKRTVSLVAAAALIIAGASAASAATIEEVPFADINSYESDIYEGWHQEHPAGDDSIAWSDEPAGVKLGETGPAQLINGLVETNAPGEAVGVDELIDLIRGASVDVAAGEVVFQIGLFVEGPGDGWTTLRPVSANADLSDQETLWTDSKGFLAAPVTLEELADNAEIAEIETVYLAGFGVHAQNEAVVSSITWDGTTFQFVEELTEVEDPEDGENGDDNGEENGDEVNEDEDLDDNDNGAETGDETSADDGDAAAATPVSGSPSYTG